MKKPEYECAELFHLCLDGGMVVVALKSKALVGSPKYLILSGDVLLPDVILLEKSDYFFLNLYQHLNQFISHHRQNQ